MIRSMTAYGSGQAQSGVGRVNIDVRTVNSRFLDVHLRLPDDLRQAETRLREQISQVVKRGKLELRLHYVQSGQATLAALDEPFVNEVAKQLAAMRRILPDMPPPSLFELHKHANLSLADGLDTEAWLPLCYEACEEALAQLQANREREGLRLATEMQGYAKQISAIVVELEAALPQMMQAHQAKITERLRDTLAAAHPDGFAQISGDELSARIAQEASLFSMRADVAEELTRLRSHVAELHYLLGLTPTSEADQSLAPAPAADKKNSTSSRRNVAGSTGKRLDFLFQEMHREANTLGSKAAELAVTHAAIDLKLLIEQLREQAQNIE
ncbi:MAG TPA: DUF1732 domain-containing protein [Burkholderiaceae bacterium]|nr:DUF1732 domain-containing protein [Burkholderiaceae bacterium]